MAVYKEIWDEKNKMWVKKSLCQNAVRNVEVNYGRGIGIPQCYDNIQEYEVTIYYKNCLGDEFDQNTVYLCRECLSELEKSARKWGHSLKYRKIEV
jgi:hypothetical protein